MLAHCYPGNWSNFHIRLSLHLIIFWSDWVRIQDIGGSKGFRGICALRVLFSSSYLYLSLAGSINVYAPNQGTNRQKCALLILSIKGKMPPLAGFKHLSVHFFLHGPRLFHFLTKNVRAQSVRNGHQSAYFRADTLNNNIKQKTKKFS